MILNIDSDPKKGWIASKGNPFTVTIFNSLPGAKKFRNGILYFELSRANVEMLETMAPDAVWRGPIKDKRKFFAEIRENERKSREQKLSDLPPVVDFPFKTKPYEHQLKAFSLGRGKEYYGYFMEQGCVDLHTEYLTPTGWRKISDYDSGPVAQWNLDGSIEFVEPEEYHVKPCDVMMRFKTKYGVDQKLSLDHRMLLTYGYKPKRRTLHDGWCEYLREEGGRWLIETNPHKLSVRVADIAGERTKAYVPCHFSYSGPGLALTDEQIRLQVAFIADGSYGVAKMDVTPTKTREGSIRIKKDRKKTRLIRLLEEAGVSYKRRDVEDGFSIFTFIPPINHKHFIRDYWWNASEHQKLIISEECLYWDGSVERKQFFSSREEDAEFIQFCYNSTGRRARITVDSREGWNSSYVVTWTEEPLELMKGSLEPTEDGKMYCFTVPSSYLVFRRNGCVFVSGNTGKTKVMLDDAADIFLHGGYNGGIDTLVVIAPNGVHRQWVTEQIPTHLSDAVKYRAAYTTASPSKEEAAQMAEMLAFSDGLRIISVHTEFLSSKKGKQFLFDLASSCNAMCLVDESTRFKEKSSGRTTTLLSIASLFKYRRIATGTPVTQGVQDLFTQFSFLSENILGYNSFYSFRNHFCKMGGFQNKKIVGVINEDELISKIDSHSFRVTKEECLDLPERIYIRREVPLTDRQREVYRQLKQKFLLELESGEIVTVKMAMTRMTRLQQIANGFLWIRQKKNNLGDIVTEEVHEEYPTNRVQATVDILEESKTDQKFIIWLKYEGDYELLAPALKKAGISFTSYTGNLSSDEAEANLEKFKTDKSIKVLLSTPKKGGIGLNLTVASNVIWFSRDFSLENELQANDRIHRMGQTEKVVVYYLVAPNTVDEHIEKIQAAKLATATSLVDYKDFI